MCGCCPCLAAEILIIIKPMNVCWFSFNVYFNQSIKPLTIKPSKSPSSNQAVLRPYWTTWMSSRCPADVEVNNDLLRSGGPPPPARGAPRAELDEYIRRKWAAKLRDQDDQGRAKPWVMCWCFRICWPRNLDVWDWSKHVELNQLKSGFDPENFGRH